MLFGKSIINIIKSKVILILNRIRCGPCQMMQPVLEDLASRLEDVARIAKVDTDKSPRLASRYQVEALPTLILFHKGKVVEKYIGYRSADDLEQEIKKYLKTL